MNNPVNFFEMRAGSKKDNSFPGIPRSVEFPQEAGAASEGKGGGLLTGRGEHGEVALRGVLRIHHGVEVAAGDERAVDLELGAVVVALGAAVEGVVLHRRTWTGPPIRHPRTHTHTLLRTSASGRFRCGKCRFGAQRRCTSRKSWFKTLRGFGCWVRDRKPAFAPILRKSERLPCRPAAEATPQSDVMWSRHAAPAHLPCMHMDDMEKLGNSPIPNIPKHEPVLK